MQQDFIWSDTPEPHIKRRNKILQKYPEIKHLYGYEWRSKYICTCCLIIPQLYLSIHIHKLSWFSYIMISYCVGATITQAIFLAIHELSHNLFFQARRHNKLFAYFANLPIGIPFSITFRQYHMEHHTQMGVDGVDTDIPTNVEVRFIKGKYLKCIWCFFQIVAYALRPMCIKVHNVSKDLIINWVIQLLFNIIWVRLHGLQSLRYFLLCDLLAGGLHPCAGHFISEHYVFDRNSTHDTFSYYGKLNYLTWNVGYHNEHHDFPLIPWSRLPIVKKIAPEFYNMETCTSWLYIFIKYISDDTLGPSNRMKRALKEMKDS